MTALTRPDVRLCRSWSAAMAEFGDDPVHGAGTWYLPAERRHDLTSAGCAAYVAELARHREPGAGRPAGAVPCDFWWITDRGPDGSGAEEVVGFLALRHRLTAWLRQEGGHLGYSVRPSRRREGHAVRALRQALDLAAGLGIERALVTCHEENVASRGVIERCGGVHEDTWGGTRRYWLATGPGPAGAAVDP